MFSTTSWGASLLWASEATSSLLAGKFMFGRYCWSWPRSRLPRLPKLMRFLPLVASRHVAIFPTRPARGQNVTGRQARASSKVSAGLVGVAHPLLAGKVLSREGRGLTPNPSSSCPYSPNRVEDVFSEARAWLRWLASCLQQAPNTGEVDGDESAENTAGRAPLRGAGGVWAGSARPGLDGPRSAGGGRDGVGALAIRALAINRRRARRPRTRRPRTRRPRARRAAGRVRT